MLVRISYYDHQARLNWKLLLFGLSIPDGLHQFCFVVHTTDVCSPQTSSTHIYNVWKMNEELNYRRQVHLLKFISGSKLKFLLPSWVQNSNWCWVVKTCVCCTGSGVMANGTFIVTIGTQSCQHAALWWTCGRKRPTGHEFDMPALNNIKWNIWGQVEKCNAYLQSKK